MENEKVQVENTSANNEYKYTQQDMDNITEKVREKTYQNALKTMIDKREYETLLEKYNELANEKKQSEFKAEYIKKGGNENYFNDFYKLNPNIEIKDIEKTMRNSPWVYNQPNYKVNDSPLGESKPFDATNIYEMYQLKNK